MTDYRLPDDVRMTLTDDIATYIERYRPSGVPASDWLPLEQVVKPLVASTQPRNVADANVTLGCAVHFVRWAAPRAGTLEARVVITDLWVDRFGRENPRQLKPGTAATQLGRLRRLVRVTRGESPCTRRAPREAGPAPYGLTERELLDAASREHPSLSEVLQLTDRGAIHRTSTPPGWESARRDAADGGVNLRLDRLRATFVLDQLARPLPAAQILRTARLSRADVDNTLPHLVLPDAATCSAQLRG